MTDRKTKDKIRVNKTMRHTEKQTKVERMTERKNKRQAQRKTDIVSYRNKDKS